MIGLRESVACGAATRKVISKDVVLTSFKTQAEVCAEPEPEVKGSYGHDSDTDRDSGIVGCGQRVGSTSSTDTDSSQEFRQKVQFRTPLVTNDSAGDSLNNLQFRTVKRGLIPHGGPFKGDHALLKDCNRRPPTPLTVLAEPNQCVRFDDQLSLSEQSIRRSCRKLFATLYAQRFSYTSNVPPDTVLQNRRQKPLEPQLRLQPRSVIDKGAARTRSSMDSAKDVPVGRKAVSWNLSLPGRRVSLEQMPVPETKPYKQGLDSTSHILKGIQVPRNIPNPLTDCRPSLKASTDSGISGCKSRCTCQNGLRDSSGSSQSSSSSNCSSSTNHSCCCHESCNTQVLKSPSLFKSNSCSTLPNGLLQPTLVRNDQQQQQAVLISPKISQPHPPATQRGPIPLQKTSSCTNLMNRTRNVPISSVSVYGDNMMHHVFAQVASVVPDQTSKPTNNVPPIPQQSKRNESAYDSVRLPPVAVPASMFGDRANAVTFRSYKSTKRNPISVSSNISKEEHSNSSKCPMPLETKDRILIPSKNYASPSLGRLVPYRQGSRENPYVAMGAPGRPPIAVIPGMEKQPVFLKSALKQPQKSSQLSVHHLPSPQTLSKSSSHSKVISEAEYAVVDKSKKNRFSSLPALNQEIPNPCPSEEQPPVPPKKNLHKSDFNIYRSRSSSPKKSLIDRMNHLTRSAKSAFQKAFSTERIYRPEKEERLEAAGQTLHRSKSIMKGLRASLSKKRRKNKPPMAEVVPQTCNSQPIWDENSPGPNPPIRVRGQLLQLNLDGSQVVELSKPPNKPYGFFVARGRVRNSRGVFVSRMRDQETQKQLSGILDIGDEILEIEGRNVKNSDIIEVNNLMANKNTLLLTVLPYICRKDI